MITLKQNTARTAVFFAHDVNGDGVTGIADGSWTKRISKNGGAFAAMTVTITEMENGWYSFPLSTTHTDTLGFLALSFSSASSKRVNMLFSVSARLLDDLCFPTVSGQGLIVNATGNADANVEYWSGETVLPLDASGRVQAISDLITDAVLENLSGGFHTADSGTTTTLTDAELIETSTDYWKGALIVFKTGTLARVARLVTAFNPATDTLTFAPATPVAVGTHDYWLIPHGAVDVAQWLATTPNALVSGRVDASVGAMGADVVTAAAIATGAIDADALASGAITSAKFAADAIDNVAFAASAAAEIADKLLGRGIQGGADGGRTVTDALRYLRNRVAISAGTMTVYQENDSTSAWTAAVTTAAGNPISEIDPA